MTANVLEVFASDRTIAGTAKALPASPPVPPMTPIEPRSPAAPRRWAVVMADNSRRLVEARGFRIESGAVVFVEPVGCVAAFAPGAWLSIEEDRNNA